ncbi:hypothetical protein GVAV_001571 [Gurleya vavrai]
MKKNTLKDYLSTKRIKKAKIVLSTIADDQSSSEDQLRLIDGKIVFDDTICKKKQKYESKPIIDDSDIVITSTTFNKRLKTVRWNKPATDLFFEALAMVGTDFTRIGEVFNLDRKVLRNKFIKENKNDQKRVNLALKEKLNFDKNKWKKMVEDGKLVF